MKNDHVVIIGSPWIFRQGVKQTLRRLGLSTITEGDTFDEACAACAGPTLPVIVLSLIGQSDDFEASLAELRKARVRFPGTKTVLLGEIGNPADIQAAFEASVDAVLSPKLLSRILGNSLQLVLLNQKLFPSLPTGTALRKAAPVGLVEQALPTPLPPSPPEPDAVLITSQVIRLEDHTPVRQAAAINLVWNAQQTPSLPARPGTPSEREWEILQCLERGGSNKSIARDLGIAETTVKVHVKSLLRKLNVANRTQAAIWALNHSRSADEPVTGKLAQTAPAK